MRLALFQPDIAANTGAMLRLAACLGVGVDIIGPAGFDMSDRALRRAGLDYLQHVDLRRHIDLDSYLRQRWAAVESGQEPGRIVLLTTHATTSHAGFAFRGADTLMVGRESAGVPEAVHGLADARIRVPIRVGLRSLNVATAAAIVLGEALRQTDGWPHGTHVKAAGLDSMQNSADRVDDIHAVRQANDEEER